MKRTLGQHLCLAKAKEVNQTLHWLRAHRSHLRVVELSFAQLHVNELDW